MASRGRHYGEVLGHPIGSWFPNRVELAKSGLHRERQAGICGGRDGAESIVVSGGYVDDVDLGVELIYTGHGGNDGKSKRQNADQELTRGNAGLVRSQLEGFAVRVIRGAGGDPIYSPPTGFRYDGLFRVTDHWHDTGKDGFRIVRFRLTPFEGSAPMNALQPGPASRTAGLIQRIVRSSQVASKVKALHQFACQVCGTTLRTPGGLYAEAAHIRPLGRPHDGPDILSNVLCLCPNHHVLLDTGGIHVHPNGLVRETSSGLVLGRLRTLAKHQIDPGYLAYHRSIHGP